MIELVEYTDPGCIWSWSSVDKLGRLRAAYPSVRWRRVFGVPGPRPGNAEQQHASWREVTAQTGARITDRLHYVSSGALHESRAARAAEHQGSAIAEAVLLRLREATFLEGRPADSVERIAEALADVPRLDLRRLIRDLESPDVVWSIDADAAETRRPPAELVAGGVAKPDGDDLRYPFPTLIIGGRTFAGWTDYDDYARAIEAEAVAV